MANEEDRLRRQLVDRGIPWTFDRRALKHFQWENDEWSFVNLAPRDSGGFKSGPDLVFHDGQACLVVVEFKVARAGESKPKMMQQLFAYGLQAWELLDDPTLEVGTRSRDERVPFKALCAAAGLDPGGIREVVLVAATLKPDTSKHVPRGIEAYLRKEMGRVAPAGLSPFAQMLVRPWGSNEKPRWRSRVLSRLGDRSRALTWAVVEDIEAGTAASVRLIPLLKQ